MCNRPGSRRGRARELFSSYKLTASANGFVTGFGGGDVNLRVCLRGLMFGAGALRQARALDFSFAGKLLGQADEEREVAEGIERFAFGDGVIRQPGGRSFAQV